VKGRPAVEPWPKDSSSVWSLGTPSFDCSSISSEDQSRPVAFLITLTRAKPMRSGEPIRLPSDGSARYISVAPLISVSRSTTTKGSAIDPWPVTFSRLKPPSSSEKEMPCSTMVWAQAMPGAASSRHNAGARMARLQ